MADFVLGLTMWVFGIAAGLLTGITIEYQFKLIEKMRKRQDDAPTDNSAAIALLDKWLSEPEQADDGSLDRLRRLIDENRLSDRKFWPELSTDSADTRARVRDGVVATVDQQFVDAFKDTAIKCHIGFKHDGPWEKCEWIECEDRRKLIQARATSTIAAPVRPSSDSWHRWFERLGDKASAEVVNATADLVTDERLAALVDAKVLPSIAAPQDDRPRRVFDAGFSSQSPAIKAAEEKATRYFRWAYQLLLALAKRRLAEANAENEAKGEPNNWPAGQKWHEMVGSSHSIFLRGARAEAGIPEDAFMGVIRSLEIDVDDLYQAAADGETPSKAEDRNT